MKKLLSILILLGLCFIPVPVHAAESGSLIVRTVAARLHSDKTITVTETLRLRLPGHDDYELFLNLPDNSQMKAEKVKLISEQAVLDPQWNRVQFNRDTDVELQLEYTLQLFQDENDQADTLTLNLASSLWICRRSSCMLNCSWILNCIGITGFWTAAKAAINAGTAKAAGRIRRLSLIPIRS